jgi:hypothetical protein
MCNSSLDGECDAHYGGRLPLSIGFPPLALLESDRVPRFRDTIKSDTVGCKTVSLPVIRGTNLHF